MKRKTTEEIIKLFKEKHNNKYDYSKVNYVNASTKVCIICPKHGEFWQVPNSHLQGCGCPKCKNEKNGNNSRKTNENFISESIEKHCGKYDYSKVNYVNASTKVCIICPEHGEFWQTPHNHLYGYGCSICGHNKTNKSLTKQAIDFVKKANIIHNNRYDYSKINYINSHSNICIICPEHGEFFQMATHHLNGKGCPICGKEKSIISRRSNIEEFIQKATIIHNNKYNYSKANYINAQTDICIECPEHGEFWQKPYHHLAGCGCPKCKSSRLETDIRKLLLENNFNFEEQKKFDWLGLQSLDFYLPDHKVAIECQGIQHFEPIEHFGGKEALNETIIRDTRKKELCNLNNIEMVYFTLPVFEKYVVNDIHFINQEELVNYLLSKN